MANIVVIGELANGQIRKVSLEMMSKAAAIAAETGGKADVILLGTKAREFVQTLTLYGANEIFISEKNIFDEYKPELFLQTLLGFLNGKNYNAVLLGATLQGKDLAAMLAARLETGLAMDTIEIRLDGDRLLFKRPVYSGKAYAFVKIKSDPQIATIRSNNLELVELSGKGTVTELSTPDVTERVSVLERLRQKSERIDATEASIVVSGGRGMKSMENFRILEELADVLGAGIGASRAATDAGWRPHSDQIGQTGKVVSPNLYIACGISGAIQHMAGCGSSKYIVAVNKDPDAPIFQVATYGIVHDLHEFVPVFTEEVKKVRSN